MIRKNYVLRGLLVLLMLFTLIGCAAAIKKEQINKRLQEIKAVMDPLMGKSKEDVLLALGPPQRQETIGKVDVWLYHKSFGQRQKANLGGNQYYVAGNAQTWEAYDDIKVFFKGDIAVKWDSYVQR